MCTVSYVPTTDGFVFTSNRDEHVSRAAIEIKSVATEKSTLYYPEDPIGKGSWISMTKNGQIACLLNGAFKKHKRQLPYRKSRGEILLSSFKYADFDEFVHTIDLTEIEPFTMILISADQKIIELIWDGQKHIKELDKTKIHFWSSCTLYDAEISNQKEINFKELLDLKTGVTQNYVYQLHDQMRYENLISEKANDLLMTTSITQINMNNKNLSFEFNSLFYAIAQISHKFMAKLSESK